MHMNDADERNDDKRRENRARRKARRQGFRLIKSRSRSPEHYNFGGFVLVDCNGFVEAGGNPHEFAMKLEDVERFLADPST